MSILFNEFRIICLQLNAVGIEPTLMGSLGLEYISKEDWKPADIDIHVPGDPRGWEAPDDLRIYNWDKIKGIMEIYRKNTSRRMSVFRQARLARKLH